MAKAAPPMGTLARFVSEQYHGRVVRRCSTALTSFYVALRNLLGLPAGAAALLVLPDFLSLPFRLVRCYAGLAA